MPGGRSPASRHGASLSKYSGAIRPSSAWNSRTKGKRDTSTSDCRAHRPVRGQLSHSGAHRDPEACPGQGRDLPTSRQGWTQGPSEGKACGRFPGTISQGSSGTEVVLILRVVRPLQPAGRGRARRAVGAVLGITPSCLCPLPGAVRFTSCRRSGRAWRPRTPSSSVPPDGGQPCPPVVPPQGLTFWK